MSRSTVVNILKAEGIDPVLERGEGTWDEFVMRHAETLWACDFFSRKVWDASWLGRGVRAVLHPCWQPVRPRRWHTANPDRAWMTQQARNLAMHFAQPVPPRDPLCDNDGKFVTEFDAILKDEGVEVLRLPVCSANLNAFAERFVLSIKSECLDHFIVGGETHLRDPRFPVRRPLQHGAAPPGRGQPAAGHAVRLSLRPGRRGTSSARRGWADCSGTTAGPAHGFQLYPKSFVL